MISLAIDKKEYMQTMKVEAKSEGSFADVLPRKTVKNDFRTKLVRAQWSYAKKQLKEFENPRTLIETGDLYLLKDNYRKAVDYYQKALVLDSQNIPAYEKIIYAFSLHKEFQQAEEYFLQLLELTKNRKDVFRKYVSFRVNRLFQIGGDIDETLQLIEKAIKIDATDFELVNTYGFILLNFKQSPEEANKYFDQAISLNSEYIHAINNKGVCLIRSDKPKESESYFKTCIQIDPHNYPFSYQNLALAYMLQKEFQEVWNTTQKAKENKVRINETTQHLEGWVLLEMNRFEEAAIWYTNRLAQEPSNQLLMNNLGFCYVRLGFPEKGEQLFREAVNLSEKKIRMHGHLDKRALRAYYNLGRSAIGKADANEIYDIAHKINILNSGDAFALYLRGASDSLEKRYESAKGFFENALNLDPTIQEVYPDYAFILESIDRNYDGAIALLEKALRLGFKTTLIYNNLAFAYIRTGKHDKAENIIKMFDKGKDTHPYFLATMGLLEIRKGNLKKGNSLYDHAIEKLSSKNNQNLARQNQLIETARAALKENDIKKATELIAEVKQLPKTFLEIEIKEIEKEITTAT